MGVENPPEDYSLGFDLLGKQKRDYTEVMFLMQVCYIDDDYKASFSTRTTTLRPKITRRDDRPVKDTKAFFESHRAVLFQRMDEMGRFSKN